MFVVVDFGDRVGGVGEGADVARCGPDRAEQAEGRPFWKLKPLQIVVTLVIILWPRWSRWRSSSGGPCRSAGRSGRDQRHRADRVALREVAGDDRARPGGLRRPLLQGPNAKISGVRWITGGAVAALLASIAASIAFALYVSNFRLLQQDLRRAGRSRRLPPVAVADEPRHPARRRVQRQDRRAEQLHGGVEGAQEELKLPEREPGPEQQPPSAR
jgi:membrane protein